jgi:predicted nucleic acid-binding protein
MMLALVLEERHTEAIVSLMDRWIDEGIELHAPLFAKYEVTNVLTGKRSREEITAAKVDTALTAIESLVVIFDVTPDNARVLEIALDLQRHKAYDIFYVELAERLDAELWTLDKRLARNAGDRYPVNLVE